MSRRKKVCLVATVPALLYMFNHAFIPYLQEHGWEVTGLTSPDQEGFGTANYNEKLRQLGVKMVHIPITREPHLFKDFISLVRLWWFFLWHRFDVVHASHPKPMLLAMIAAFFAFQPYRVITVRGRVYENVRGIKRRIFIWMDRIACFFANQIIVVSRSLRDAMLKDHIGTTQRLRVIACGGSQGCNAEHYSRDQVPEEAVAKLRSMCHLNETGKVLLFAGRLRKDKGVIELISAFEKISAVHSDWHLVLFGHEEKASDIGDITRSIIKRHPKIHIFDWTSDLRVAYKMADIFVLPTHREGFPNVVLEASAMELPVITTTAVGAMDSVIDGETGFLVPLESHDSLFEKMEQLIIHPELRQMMGRNGRRWILNDFSPTIIWEGILSFYTKTNSKR